LPTRARRRATKRAWFTRASPLVVIVALLVVWEAGVRVFGVPA
jgi:hypothetical protein